MRMNAKVTVDEAELYALQAKEAAYNRMIENNAAIAALLMEMTEEIIEKMRRSFQAAASLGDMLQIYKEVKAINQDARQALTGRGQV